MMRLRHAEEAGTRIAIGEKGVTASGGLNRPVCSNCAYSRSPRARKPARAHNTAYNPLPHAINIHHSAFRRGTYARGGATACGAACGAASALRRRGSGADAALSRLTGRSPTGDATARGGGERERAEEDAVGERSRPARDVGVLLPAVGAARNATAAVRPCGPHSAAAAG